MAKQAGLLSAETVSDEELIPDDEEFVRMTLAERIQHIVLFTCFFTLVLTGIPLVFPNVPLLHKLFFFPGSFWLRGIIHRVAGVRGAPGMGLVECLWGRSCGLRGQRYNPGLCSRTESNVSFSTRFAC